MEDQGEGYSPARLAEAVAAHQQDLPPGRRCKRQNIEQLLDGDFRTVRYIVALAAAMNTTAEALTEGRYTSSGRKEATTEETANDLLLQQYNVGGGMSTGGKILLDGQPGIIRSWKVSPEWLRINVPVHTGVANLAIVTGFGPSMKPMFNPGDPLLVDTGVKVIDHEGVYFFRVGDEGFIKLIQRVPEFNGPGVVLRVISKNPDFPPYDLSPKNPHLQVLGKVLTVWRSEQY